MSDLSASDWRAAFALLDTALDLPPEQREPWLSTLSGVDARFVPALRGLLARHAAMESANFLRRLPAFTRIGGDEEDREAGLVAGGRIGPYALIARLGAGGMGSVWLAERTDGLLARRVALKLPHAGWALPDFAARLAQERKLLASLEHPRIARLYDAGIAEDGRPWLALEVVHGRPIDVYCAEGSLPVNVRLRLVLQVMQAVAYAHSRLIVHRDLKPSNILVDDDGCVHLLDFGIGKLLDSEGANDGATRLGVRAFTPDYGSPEQLRGDLVTTATDVYSLGVVLYELLAGRRPHRREPGHSLEQAVITLDPPPPSRVAAQGARGLDVDLDAIVLEALDKNPAERYPTVAAFAEDIERYLRGDPVQARRGSRWYRTGKFLRRHRLSVAGVTLVLVAILGGSAIALWQAHQARIEAARAEQIKDFALSIFEDADTDSGAGTATTAADLLNSAQARVERELAGRPEIAVELMTVIGYSLLGQGQPDNAGKILRNAVDLADRELGARHPKTLTAKVVYGEALLSLDQPKAAIALLEPAVAEARRQNATHELIDALRWLSSAQLDAGEIDAGVASARAAVAALAPAGGSVRKLDAINAWASLANSLNFARRPGQVDAARRSLLLARELYGTRLTEPVLESRILLGQGLAREGQQAAALTEMAAVLADATQLLGSKHPKIETIANFLGNTRLEAGDSVGAVDAFKIALSIAEGGADGDSGFSNGIAHYSLASALAASRRNEEALPHYEAGARLLRAAGGADAPLALRALSARALALARLGRLNESDRAFGALADAPYAGADKAVHAGREALLRSLQGRHERAIALARTSVDGLRAQPSKIAQATASNTLGTVLLAAGRPVEAIEPLREAVRLYAENQILISADHADAIAALTRADAAAGRQEPSNSPR